MDIYRNNRKGKVHPAATIVATPFLQEYVPTFPFETQKQFISSIYNFINNY